MKWLIRFWEWLKRLLWDKPDRTEKILEDIGYTPKEEKSIQDKRREARHAHKAKLRGRMFWNSRTQGTYRRPQPLKGKSVQIDLHKQQAKGG